jgi:hypothetical protein
MILACCQEMAPAERASMAGGQGAELPGLGDECSGGGGADGQDPGDFLDRGHLRVSAFVHGRFRRDHRVLDLDGLGRVPGLDRGDLCFQLLRYRHPFQPDLILPLQHIHNSTATTGTGPGTGTGVRASFQPVIFKEQRIEPCSGGMNALHHRHSVRPVFHRNIF